MNAMGDGDAKNRPAEKTAARTGVLRSLLPFLSAPLIAAASLALLETARILTSGSGPFLDEVKLLVGLSLALTTAALALAILTVRALTNRLSIALFTVPPLTFALLFAHNQKMATLGKPLVPADLSLLRELKDVMGTVVAGHEFTFGAAALLAALFLFLIIRSLTAPSRLPMTKPARAIALALAISAAAVCAAFPDPILEFLERRGVENVVWSYGYNLRTNGFLLPLLMNARQRLPMPEGYGPDAVSRVFERFSGGTEAAAASPESPKEQGRPDIIVFMAEAFWDVTQLQGVRFSQDPIPTFHRLAASEGARLFSMMSPQRGGGTANVEFEALTGISHALLPAASVPYQHYVRQPLKGLPAVLREMGYTARAFHNFHRYYFSRASVYPLLGFESFTALDELSPVGLDGIRPEGFVNHRGIKSLNGTEALIDGRYPSDEPLVRRLAEELEKPADRPKFLFAVGMVGHGPFLYDRWPSPEVRVEAAEGRPPLSESAEKDLENMANAAFRADRCLAYLTEAIRHRGRPTLLVFFGDHLPALKNETFAEAGFENGEKDHNRYRTQVLFWANAPLSLSSVRAGQEFSVFYLAPKILAAAGLPLPPHLRLLPEFEKTLPAMNDGRLLTPDGHWLSGPRDAALAGPQKEVVRALELLGYDRLAGSQFSEGAAMDR